MEKQMIDKTSFSEICKILKNETNDIYKVANSIFNIVLIFFPLMICKQSSFLMNIVNSATLLGAKPIVENSLKNIKNIIVTEKPTDFCTRYNNVQVAQVLIVYSAFFDSMQSYLPDEEGNIKITSIEKEKITKEGIAKYIKRLENNMSQEANQTVKDILDFDLSVPNPIQNLDDYLNNLKEFYQCLNKEFLHFYESFSFWELMEERKKNYFLETIREIPDIAVQNYKRQYYQLAAEFNDFFVWTNMQEHKNIEKKLDVGFEKISACLREYYEKSNNIKVRNTMTQYNRKYEAYVNSSVADRSEIDFYSIEQIVFPKKYEIFIPQGFKTVIYRKNMNLEDEKIWDKCEERDYIGKFIGDVLRHSVTGALPLLILGHPGSGKTLLCHMLATRILCHEYHVIIVKLRDVVAEQTIQKQINQQIEKDFSNGCLWNDIVYGELDKPILIIFDGYDELLQASGKTYSDYLQKITEFQREQKDIYGIFIKCIVTSRITLINKATISDNTPVLLLTDFKEDRIERWCEIWNKENEKYFTQTGIKEFKINPESKVYELAKQPLLLLMLALYDSNNNALKDNKNLRRTQLYYNLIHEFVLREKRKNSIFRSLQKDKQISVVDDEIQKISIAAIGMYNRKTLYIHTDELQKDLQYIKLNETHSEIKDNTLTESDKILGKFFFIHRSYARNVNDENIITNIAYEFLHNTFGEFLTVYFIVNELKSVIEYTHTLWKTNKKEQWKLRDQRKWIVCMAYTPLFSRPNIVKMMYEYALSCFKKENINEIKNDLDIFLDNEINNVINGKTILDFKEVMEEKNNPFFYKNFLNHLAIYSLNLIICRTVIFSGHNKFRFSDEIWKKLVCMWRYTFSENELGDFANQFETLKENDLYEVCYIKTIDEGFQSKLKHEMKICSAVGDSTMYAVIAALIGDDDFHRIKKDIDNNELNICTRYLWNHSFNYLIDYCYNASKFMRLMERVIEFGWEEWDEQYLLSSYMLIDYIIKNVKIDKTDEFDIITIIIQLLTRISEFYDEHLSEVPATIFEIASNLLDNIQEENVKMIWECFKWEWHSVAELYYTGKLINKILKKICPDNEYLNNFTLKSQYFEKYINQTIYVLENKERILYRYLEVWLGLVNHMVEHGYSQNEKIHNIYYFLLNEIKIDNKMYGIDQKIIVIESIYEILNMNLPFSKEFLKEIFDKVIYPIKITEIYEKNQVAFKYFLYLINHHIVSWNEKYKSEIVYIVKYKNDQLLLDSYEKIKLLANNVGCKELIDILRDYPYSL